MTQRTLWQFATTLYSQPQVADACLWLQDHCAVDVNMLLFALWVAADAPRALDVPAIASIDAQVRAWRQEIVVPLRDVRRRMKMGPDPAPSIATEKLRSKLKAVEVEAEKIELALLEALAQVGSAEAECDRVASAGEPLLQQNAQSVVAYFCPEARAVGGQASDSISAGISSEKRAAIAVVVSAADAMRIAK